MGGPVLPVLRAAGGHGRGSRTAGPGERPGAELVLRGRGEVEEHGSGPGSRKPEVGFFLFGYIFPKATKSKPF